MFQKKRSTRELVQGTANARDAEKTEIIKEEAEPEKQPKQKKRSQKRPPKERGRGEFIRSKMFWGVASTAAALLIAFGGVPAVVNEVGELVDVVVFAEDVKAGSVITQDLLEYRQMTAYNLQPGAFLDMEQVQGCYVTKAAAEGDVVTSKRVSETYPGGSPELANLPEGQLAVSFTLADLAESVSSKLQAGDVIQIFAVPDSQKEEGKEAAQMPPELQCVRVLSVTGSDGTDTNETDAVLEEAAPVISTVTVEVNRQQAAVLIGLEHTSTLHAALVVRGNDERAKQALEQQASLLAQPENEGGETE